MKNYQRKTILSVASLLLLGFAISNHLPRAFTASSTSQKKDATIGVSVRPGFPHVSFADGKELASADAKAQAAGSQPITLVSADFDSDGVPDLVTADRHGGLKLYRGNTNYLFPNSPQAKAQAVEAEQAGRLYDSGPFHITGQMANVSSAPDFLFAGDFNADGHADILAATRGADALRLLVGDGRGNFVGETKIALSGAITSVAAGEIGRADGQTDVAVCVTTKLGVQLLVFEHPEGAFKYKPEAIKIPAPATNIALGNLDDDSYNDVALAVGSSLIVVHGRGQAYPWDMMKGSGIKRPAAFVQTRQLGFSISALVFGNFGARRGDALVILSEDGSLSLLEGVGEKHKTAPKTLLEGTGQTNVSNFAPGGFDARYYVVAEQGLLQNADPAEKLGLLLADRSIAGKDTEEFFRQRGDKVGATASSQLSKPSPEKRSKVRGAEQQRLSTERGLAKASFMRSLAPRPAPLATLDLHIVLADTRLRQAANTPGGANLVKARVSNSGYDDLLLLDPTNGQMQIVIAASSANNSQSGIRHPPSEIILLDVERVPVAVLPMRLNADAASDLLVLREGSSSPFFLPSAAANAFVVNSTGDELTCDDGGTCTLRGAIARANNTAGADAISFNIGGGGVQTILPATQLPDIKGTVTIDGTTQPGFNGAPLIEIKGVNVPAGKDGLRINASNCVVRGLVVNEFSSETAENGFSQIGGNGIAIFNFLGESFAGNNIIEGNYLGTDPTGILDKGNDATGLLVFGSDNNIIGGTTAAARNVMSGSGNGEQSVPFLEPGSKPGVGLAITAGNNHQIKGNFIGTNALGTSRINNTEGIFLSGKNNLTGGDEAGAGNTISGNGDVRPVSGDPDYCIGRGVGVEVLTNANTGELLTLDNVFKGNKIGTTANGAAPLGNCSTGITFRAMTNTVLGSITEGGRNTISGNTFEGVHCLSSFDFFGEEPAFGQCTIVGNNVGTDITGTQAIPNNFDNPVFEDQIGLFVAGGSIWLPIGSNDAAIVGAPGGTTSGGPCTGFCNLVSGNDSALGGIYKPGYAEGIALVVNNYVGTNRAGAAALPNTTTGVRLFRGEVSLGTVFTDQGGNLVSGRNVISGNTGGGADLGDGDYEVAGNLIGTSVDGANAIPNSGLAGLTLQTASPQSLVGGTGPLRRNVIAGNSGDGIRIAVFASNTIAIFNNYVGVDASGQPLGNGKNGVAVYGIKDCSADALRSVLIGGRDPGQANVIRNNGAAGVFVYEDTDARTSGDNCPVTSRNVTIAGNSIADNVGLGIDLTTTSGAFSDGDGVTNNDCFDRDEGANQQQNFPELFAPVTEPGGAVTVTGFLRSVPTRDFIIDFYASTSADPSTYGEGETYLGSQSVHTNGNGFVSFTFTLPGTVTAGQAITATATDADGNTSEFSCAAGVCSQAEPRSRSIEEALARADTATCSLPIYVNVNTDETDADTADGVCDIDTSNTGEQCSLRAAIEEANARPGFDYIGFNIPGGGVQTITPATALPPLTEEFYLDGTSQPGYAPNAPVIELRGDQVSTNSIGLRIQTSDSRVMGLDIHSFGAQILINNPQGSADGNSVEQCFVGIYPGGQSAPSSDIGQFFGIAIGGQSRNNTIGGPSAENGNVIANCPTANVNIAEGAENNHVINNKIGTNKDGTDKLRNGAFPQSAGVRIAAGARSNFVGGLLGEDGNLIAGHATGVLFDNAQNNRVSGNLIGPNPTGDARLGNDIGIEFTNNSQRNTIGGSVSGRNIISGNITGINIRQGGNTHNTISGNYIGTTRDGTSALTNIYDGISVGSGNNTIGGSANAPNVISGNGRAGIFIVPRSGEGPLTGTTISHNRIGTNADGSGELSETSNPEQSFGIYFQRDVQNTNITDNLISGNKFTTTEGTNSGIGIAIINGPTNIFISRNRIGTNANGNSAISNFVGVAVVRASNVTIRANLISGNGIGVSLGEGVESVEGQGGPGDPVFTENVRVQGNRIGTDASGNGRIENQSAIGILVGKNAVNNQLGGFSSAGEGNTISGHNLGNALFIGTLSENPSAGEIPSGNKIQGNRIGSQATADLCLPNKTGITLAYSRDNLFGTEDESLGEDLGNVIVCNGTGLVTINGVVENNIIGFNRFGVLPNAQENVGNTGDGMVLKDTGGNTVVGNTIGNSGGYGIVVQGSTQPRPAPRDLKPRSERPNEGGLFKLIGNKIGVVAPGGIGGFLKVSNLLGGIKLDNAGNVQIVSQMYGVSPLLRNIIAGNGGPGILIQGPNSTENVISGAIVGTDEEGTPGLGNAGDGVKVVDAPTNLIGGENMPDGEQLGNVISGNGGRGVSIEGGSATGNSVQGNKIGVVVKQSGALGRLANAVGGILIKDSPFTKIGPSLTAQAALAQQNIISGNGGPGIHLTGPLTQFTSVFTSTIGSVVGLELDLGNDSHGVLITDGAAQNTIGGPAEGSGNTITENDGAGVRVDETGGDGNVIDPNVIHSNGGLGIDLGALGLTPNDSGDADSGPNQLQNYPEFSLAVINSAGNLIVQYNVDSAPTNSNYGADGLYIEFFKADVGLEGQSFIGSTRYTVTNYNNGSPGTATINLGAAAGLGVSVGDKIVATATDADNNTSEFTGANVGSISSPTAATAIIEGQIITADGAPLAGVTIALSGTQSRRTITDDSGHYRFAEVETNGFYTVEPARANFNFTPANRSFSALGNRTDAAFTAVVDSRQMANPLDMPEYFVRQHYLDFLGREPDESGFNFWTYQIRACGSDAACVERRTINVSAAYFLSIEFQQTGGLVDGLYRASYGRRPQFAEFITDTAIVGQGVVVGAPNWAQHLDANKQAFVEAWVRRPDFQAAYGGLANADYVDKLLGNANAFNGDRDALVSGLNHATLTRAEVLKQIVENDGFVAGKRNAAFVMMQYFGYLRRDPDEAGYHFWLNKLNEFNGNFEGAEMVKAFLVSGEYRQRFR